MGEKQVLILDCNGDARPVICFNLEVAGYKMRVLTDENETINLLDNTRLTGEVFIALLVNNPFLNVDISKIVAEVQRIDFNFPIIFVKESANLRKIIEDLSAEHSDSRVYSARPTEVVDLLEKFSPSVRRAS